jgi:pimeloyl-ACP methyl ester carboxylesterase
MDVKAAHRLVAAMSEHRAPAFPGDLEVLVTPDAGHYPALDQPGKLAQHSC